VTILVRIVSKTQKFAPVSHFLKKSRSKYGTNKYPFTNVQPFFEEVGNINLSWRIWANKEDLIAN
jgi:hypothetical protein